MPPLSAEAAQQFVADHHRGVLVTLKRDGRPQLSNIMYAVLDGRVCISVTDDRAKTTNARRDPRVSLHVTSDDFWTYVVAEGQAECSALTTSPGDATGQALLAGFEAVQGAHPDHDEFFQAMVDQRRLQLSFAIDYCYPTSA